VISTAVHRILAHDAAETVLTNLNQVLNQPHSGLLSLGLIVTLWVASGGMSMTMTALDAALEVKKAWPFYVQRPMAILLTIVVTVMIMIVFVLLPIGTAIMNWLAATRHIPYRVLWALAFARYFLAILLLQSILVMLYSFGTSVRRKIDFFNPGALFTLLVWLILAWGFRIYVDRFASYQKTYGAVGGVAILLLFFYLDALVLLVGGEINSLVNTAGRNPNDQTQRTKSE
jgi:membrane protein